MSFSRVFGHLSILAVLLTFAAPDVLAQGNGRMRGQVVNADTDEPMEGVTIVATLAGSASVETVTDSAGRFQVIGLRSGQWDTVVSKDGFHDASMSVRVTQSDPVPVTFRILRVRSALELALGDEALEGLDPAVVEADLAAADAAFNAQDYEGAIAGYQSLLEILPQLTNLHLQIGAAYRAMGDNEKAIESFETLLAIDPSNSEVETEIARTRLAMGDLDGAADLAANVSLDSSREDLYNLGELEFAKGEIDTAAGWYEKAAATDPSWELPWFKLALVALNKGDMDTAKTHFQKVVELAPDSESGVQAQATLDALP